MRVRVLAAVCAASFGLAACGGDGESAEEEQGPAEVTEAWFTAFVTGDGETACGLTSEAGLESLEPELDGQSCEDAIETGAAEFPPEVVENIDSATYEVVEETEDTASVEVSSPSGSPETFDLVVEDGEWKMNG